VFYGCDSLNYNIYGTIKYLGNRDTPYLVACSTTNKNLTNYEIHNQTRFIEDHVFENCKNLTSITIPDGVTRIGESAFKSCTSLNYNIYGGIKYLGNEDNPYLVAISTTDNKLTSYEIHKQTKFFAGGVFKNCIGLTRITIPNGVREIGMYAFYDCRSLTEIVLPDYLQIIPMNTFEKCLQLNKIVLPKGLCVVEEYAFTDCKKLATVYHKGTAEDWNAIRFENGNDLIQNVAVQHNYDNGNPVPSDAPVGPADPNFAWPEGYDETTTIFDKIVVAIETLIGGIVFIILAPIIMIISTIISLVTLFL
jgi:hypothetical protein